MAGRKMPTIEDPAISCGEYKIYSDCSLRQWHKDEIIRKLREAEDGMQNALAVSHEVLELVRGWEPVVVHCCKCRHEDFMWLPGGMVNAFCRNEFGLKGPLRGNDFCPYGEEREKK